MSTLTYNQRRYFDERLYFLYVNTYKTRDFTQWISIPEDEREDIFWSDMPTLIEEFANYIETKKYDPFSASSLRKTNIQADTWQPNYDDVMPSYCSGFKSYIGYKLMISRPLNIIAEFNKRFPRPDEIDCYYLTEVFAEIKIDLKNGFGYDPGQQNGLDTYLPPEPSLKVNLGTAKRWLDRAVAKATPFPSITYSPLPTPTLANQIQPSANQSMIRPNTTLERSQLAEKEYADTKSQFTTRDFLEWEVPIKMPDGTEGIRPYDELIPPYCHRYATALGFTFSCINAADVPLVLDRHFRTPDRLDLDYLDDVLTEIESIIGSNYSFSTSAGDGIDYYNGYGNERQMMEAEQNGVDTSNKGEWRIKANVERTRKWMMRVKENLLESPSPQPQVSQPINVATPTQTAQPSPTPTAIAPVLAWNGSVSDLAETLYRLARAGFIDLAAHCPPEGNRLALCRHLCQLFQVPITARTGAVKNLNACLGKFTAEQLAPGPIDEEALSKAIGRKPNSPKTVQLAATLGSLEPSTEVELELE